MTEQNPKSATDLLLEINDKLDLLIARFNNHDLLLKTLNNKLNLLSAKSPEPQLIKSIVESPVKDTPMVNSIPGLKPGITLQQTPTGSVLAPSPEKKESPIPKKEKAQSVSKVGVQQRIVYKEDSKSVIMATVRIFQQTRGPDNTPYSALIDEKKTNTTGKWTTALDPGEYEIKITKQGVADRSNVDISYTITVPNSEAPVNLDLKAV